MTHHELALGDGNHNTAALNVSNDADYEFT